MEYWSNGLCFNGMVGQENLTDLFPLLIPSIPPFPYSIIPGGSQRGWPQKTSYFQRVVEIPRRLFIRRLKLPALLHAH
jgi:hypothetical protein